LVYATTIARFVGGGACYWPCKARMAAGVATMLTVAVVLVWGRTVYVV
jgi:hypothetical protein